MWRAVGSETVLLREGVLAVCGALGFAAGRFERTRLGRMLWNEATADVLPADLPAEFRGMPHAFDHREDAMAKRDRF